jgi:N,N'-diacetyllegionaminate synthase
MTFESSRTYVIAELANAHQGKPETLLRMIESAAAAGADAIKVQWFKYDHLAHPDYEWYEVYQKLFFEPQTWRAALALAADLKLDVWADIFDDWGLSLAQELRGALHGVKLPPTVLDDDRLAAEILELGLPTLVGVGGWSEEQIAQRFRTLRRMTRAELVLMHGYQGYPTTLADCNLSRIAHYRATYRCRVGIADHVDGALPEALEVPVYAVCAGATIVEKHLTLDRTAKGYDYYSSLEPQEFAAMLEKIRRAEAILGGPARSENESNYLAAVPRAILKMSMPVGQILRAKDIVFRRTNAEQALTPSALKACLPAVMCRAGEVGAPLLAGDVRKPRVIIAVICRLKSTRLKRKALANIAGEPSVLRCLERCRQAGMADDVFLATSGLPEDDDLVPLAEQADVRLLRGDPESVLNRLIQVADASDADVVVRVTGDCPTISPEVLDYLITRHLASAADYTALSGQFPVGLAGDVFSVQALRRLQGSDADLSLTEYLRHYFAWNRKTFQCRLHQSPRQWRGSYRLTLDVQEDLDMFNRLYAALAQKGLAGTTTDILDLLGSHPEIAAINAHIGLIYKTNQQLVARIRKAVKIRNLSTNIV